MKYCDKDPRSENIFSSLMENVIQRHSKTALCCQLAVALFRSTVTTSSALSVDFFLCDVHY